VPLDDGFAAGKLEFVLVEGDVVQVVHPDGEGAGSDGAAEEIVAAGLDAQPDVVLVCYV
jgi:hypothetical protein